MEKDVHVYVEKIDNRRPISASQGEHGLKHIHCLHIYDFQIQAAAGYVDLRPVQYHEEI